MKKLSSLLIVSILFISCGLHPGANTIVPDGTEGNSQPAPTIEPTKIVPLPTIGASETMVLNSPSPSATHTLDVSQYQLRESSDDFLLDLYQSAKDRLIEDPDPYSSFLDTEYIDSQLAVKLVAWELINRYPDVNSRRENEWSIALANFNLGIRDSDEWVLQQISDGLNSKEYDVEQLDSILIPYGFNISVSDEIPNLLGKNQSARLIILSTINVNSYTFSAKLLAVISKNGQNVYQIAKLLYSYDITQLSYNDDHTNDGIPEIIVTQNGFNGSFCWQNILMFQWSEGRFSDLSQGQFHLEMCNPAPGEWRFDNTDTVGAESVVTRTPINYYSKIIRVDYYDWTGKDYQLTNSKIEKPEIIDENTAEWPALLMGEGNFSLLAKELPSFLNDPDKVNITNLGESYPDYLRFQLAQAYALNGKQAQAQKLLQQIVDSPNNLEVTTVPLAARAYLENYSSDKDVYRACQAALLEMEKATNGRLYEKGVRFGEYLPQVWGYSPHSLGYDALISVCNLRGAFGEVVKRLGASEFSNFPDNLSQAGVKIRSSEAVDLDGDKQPEWIFLTETPGDDAPIDVLILKKSPKGIMVLPVVAWERKKYDLPVTDTDSLTLKINTYTAPDQKIITFAKLGQWLFGFQVASGGASLNVSVFDSVDSYNVFINDQQVGVKIVPAADYCNNCDDYFYNWSIERSKFIYAYPGDVLLTLENDAETMLFERHQYADAIPLLRAVLGKTTENKLAYFQYMLGLAYELNGDRPAAIETYLKLWEIYPDSTYAFLAQSKLEPRK